MKKNDDDIFVVSDQERDDILSRKRTHVFYDEWCDWIIGFSAEEAGEIAKGIAFAFRGEEYEPKSVTAKILLKNVTKLIFADREHYIVATAKKIRGAKERFTEKEEANPMDMHSTSSANPMDMHSITNGKPMDKDGVSVLVSDSELDSVSDNDIVFPSERRKKMCSKEHIKEIVDAWNSIFANTDVPKVTVVKSGSLREKAINARLKDNSKEDIINAMHSAAHSSFLTSSSWFSFDWFMKPNNFVKVIEGNYADHAQKPAPQNKQTDKLQDFYDMAVKWAEGG